MHMCCLYIYIALYSLACGTSKAFRINFKRGTEDDVLDHISTLSQDSQPLPGSAMFELDHRQHQVANHDGSAVSAFVAGSVKKISSELAMQAMMRSCVDDLGHRFEELLASAPKLTREPPPLPPLPEHCYIELKEDSTNVPESASGPKHVDIEEAYVEEGDSTNVSETASVVGDPSSADIVESGDEGSTLPDDGDAGLAFIERSLEQSECMKLPQLLGLRWYAEDELERLKALKLSKEMLTTKLKNIEELTKQRLFSTRRAEKLCKSRLMQPNPEAVKSRLATHFEDMTTVKRSMGFSRSVQKLNVAAGDEEQLKTDLPRATMQRFELEEQVEFFSTVLRKHVPDEMKGITDAIKAALRQMLADVTESIKTLGFSYYHTLRQCQKEAKGFTLANAAGVLERILDEHNGVVTKESGRCKEKDVLYCPEGSFAASRRSFNHLKFVATAASVYPIAKPTCIGLGAGIGFLVGGPAGSATGAGIALLPGISSGVSIAIATAASADWFPKCRCFPTVCRFDASLGYCAMKVGKSKSKNPFSQLPHPGHRCVLKLPETAKPQCRLIACSKREYSQALTGNYSEVLSGSIGHQKGTKDVNNCLKVKGASEEADEDLLMKATLPSGRPNTAASRAELYEQLGVSLQPLSSN